jgi:hemerythrin
MAFINWHADLSVNVTEIDRQHQKLIAMINELHEAMKLGKGKEVLGKILESLSDYTVTHFTLEEQYFAQFGYPDAAAHIKEHAAFVQKVTEFKQGFDEGRILLSMDIMSFLTDWLMVHIKGSDKKYSSFFNEKGLT